MSRSSEMIEFAFLGCGRAARTHARTLKRVAPDVRLHFASRDAAKASRLAKEFKGAGAFGSYQAALDSAEVTVAVVTTPPDRHLELTKAALAAGKHVVVEKPAFFEPEHFGVIRELARTAGLRVFVAENYFYKPLRGRLASLLAEGFVGEPLLLRLNAVKHQAVDGWRADATRAGGGGLFEGGIHWINLMSNLGPEVERVSGVRAGAGAGAEAGSANPGDRAGGRTEETLAVTFEYSGGMVGTLAFSWEVPSPLRGVRFSSLYGRGGSVWFESNGIFMVARGAGMVARGSKTRIIFPGVRDLSGYRAMWIDFVDALKTGREPDMTLELAERDVRLVRDVYRSLE